MVKDHIVDFPQLLIVNTVDFGSANIFRVFKSGLMQSTVMWHVNSSVAKKSLLRVEMRRRPGMRPGIQCWWKGEGNPTADKR
jgi:hypothetical protein